MLTVKRQFSFLFIFSMLCAICFVTITAATATIATKTSAAANDKITICHRTSATTNPYRRITVNVSSIYNGDLTRMTPGGGNGHGQFSHNKWYVSATNNSDVDANTTTRPVANVYNPSVTYPANKKWWGDIIPSTLDDGLRANFRKAMPLNYSGAGLSIYNNTSYSSNDAYKNMCQRKTAKQFCDSEVAALMADGASRANAEQACLDELKDQDATDDVALKAACGNDIATCNFSTLATMGTTTESFTCANNVVTLNGSASISTLTGVPSILYATSAAPTTWISLSATPASITGSKSFTATTPTLVAGATYTYKAIVTVSDADSSVVEGTIGTFTLSASAGTCVASVDTTTTTVAGATTTTVAGATTTVAGATTTVAGATTTTIPGDGITGALRGRVWIDKNLNQIQDSDEPGIPFTPLVATLKSSSVGGASGGKLTFKTDALGKYSVPKLEPGKWVVTATLQTDALAKTFDTDGEVGTQSVRSFSVAAVQAVEVKKMAVIDWQVSSSVPVNGIGVADFAAAGDAAVKLQIDIPAECVKTEKVEITWAGIDLKLNTTDDATFLVDVKDQEATAERIPYGNYSVTPICTSGQKLTEQAVTLKKLQVLNVVVKASVLSEDLPDTGANNSERYIQISAMLLMAGLVLVRRRRVQL